MFAYESERKQRFMKSKRRRIVRYRKPLNINIGLIIFLLIFLYLGISCFIYLSRDKISIYEVVKGESEVVPGISTTGIMIRSEEIVNAPVTGYINYYVKEGSKVAVGSTLYTIDESGDFTNLLKEAAENSTTLTTKNVSDIKEDITSFVTNYDNMNFESTYEFRYNLNARLIECVNINALDAINMSLSASGSPTLSLNKSIHSGIIEFYTDGMEDLTVETITDSMFDTSEYKKATVTSGEMIEANSPIYKVIENENWNIVIQLTDKQAEGYKDITSVEVYFPSKGITTKAEFTIINNSGTNYGVLSLKQYLIQFSDNRYVEVHISGKTESGLKIPKTSLVEKDFYTVPSDYMTYGGDSNDAGFLVETINENGESLGVFTETDIIEIKDGICYIDDSEIEKGSILIKPNSTEKYKIESMAKLDGVYNVNNGMTSFRHVNIMTEKNGYYIVESGTTYGLQVYDQIILNASLVDDKQIIFR